MGRSLDTLEPSGIVVSLFRKHAARVRRSLGFRLRNSDDGQDAAQEVFLKLWRQERQGKLREDAAAYLNSAASSMAADFERWRAFHANERIADVEIDEVPAVAPGLDESQHWRNALAVFIEGLDTLPEPARNVFLLHHVKGLQYPEIARRLGMSLRTVERQVAHAISVLERRLRNYL